ncbi:GlxA family transcriptional regulator [Vitiosangium sp. GDMCC 1.1324]|uniref:GlxA family transcriptional regulator n=1 Tax=Vitiosangium sp. (strain GDMCC 1.1324) TaxID=2138576 RepID=UPI000D3B5365|nr:helix-turn-helix domain-containing protein [Vitiosangium sp. GDMCC 1.1324]PTL79751.1 AraC family transcriptional regulator [Vitiosangium sp. GDMCC 1.1324]
MITHLVFDGVADGPMGVALDIVGAAARIVRAGLVALPKGRLPPRQRVVSVDGASVRTAAGRTLAVDGALGLRGLGAGDVLVLPGLGMATAPEITAALERPDIVRGVELVARAAAKGALVAASCSATFVLAAARVLDGRRATTTWWLGPTFAQRFPRVTLRSDRMVVESGGVFTAGSAFAHADLMLAILAYTSSPSVAHTVARYLVLDERASQARYMVLSHLGSSDPVIRQLESFVTSHIGRQISIHEMARATATSPRTLARRVAKGLGITPQQFAQRLRVAQAVHLLETTQHPVDDVAARVGYADPAAFRRIFRRETGETPRARRMRSILREGESQRGVRDG